VLFQPRPCFRAATVRERMCLYLLLSCIPPFQSRDPVAEPRPPLARGTPSLTQP